MRIAGLRGWAGRIALLMLAAACGNGSQKETDTFTAGRIRIAADDSYRLMIEAELYTFESLYRHATIDTIFTSESDVIDLFMKDSVPFIMVNRKLTQDEEQFLRSRQIIPKTTKVAYDAVVFIVNKNNPDTAFSYDQIKSIFTGKIQRWKEINPTSVIGKLKVIFDNYKSGNPRYFKEKFGLDSFPSTCFAVSNNDEVIRYVERNPDALGVISVNWISDPQDTVSNNFLSLIKVAGISNEGNTGPEASYYKPYQAYIAEEFYPFTREVFCINRQTYRGLAYGLAAFIAGEKGQMIILRAGMVPATMPVRIVEIKK